VDYEGPFFERTNRQIRAIVRLNIESTLEMTHTLLQYRDPSAAFRVINVASLAAFYPMPVKAAYAASKRFLLDFSLALREEMRPMGASVTVLCPAGMPTNPECERGIEAQGWMGPITTMDRPAGLPVWWAGAGRLPIVNVSNWRNPPWRRSAISTAPDNFGSLRAKGERERALPFFIGFPASRLIRVSLDACKDVQTAAKAFDSKAPRFGTMLALHQRT
ncbi:MAG: SDR family NAD(P)-dependent oxidoreductase, partial [Anaerolineaceae bacterium]